MGCKHTQPQLRRLAIETAIIGRYRRRESSIEEALVETYLAGVSVDLSLASRAWTRRAGSAGGGANRATQLMIALPAGVQVSLATSNCETYVELFVTERCLCRKVVDAPTATVAAFASAMC